MINIRVKIRVNEMVEMVSEGTDCQTLNVIISGDLSIPRGARNVNNGRETRNLPLSAPPNRRTMRLVKNTSSRAPRSAITF